MMVLSGVQISKFLQKAKTPRAIFVGGLLLCVTIALLWPLFVFAVGGDRYSLDLWMSRDQQGSWFFSRGEYRQAAQRFDDPAWKAISLYAAENFDTAELLWSRQEGAVALFNRANALAHSERYQSAADGYRLALTLAPDWQPPQKNLELMLALQKKPKPPPKGNEGKANFEADEVVFDLQGDNNNDSAEREEVDAEGMSSQEIQALWMRRLQSKPVDFLRLKFSYQVSESES